MAKRPKSALPGPSLTDYQRKQIEALIDSTRRRLIEMDPDIEHDVKLFTDTMDGESDVLDELRKYGRAYLDNKAFAQATAERIGSLQERKERYERRADAFKAALHAYMQVAGIPNLPDTDFVAYTMDGKQKVNEDIDEYVNQLPDQYVRTERKPNKALILEHLQRNIEVPFARLTNGSETLVIRGK